jgi:hypothetical protein
MYLDDNFKASREGIASHTIQMSKEFWRVLGPWSFSGTY